MPRFAFCDVYAAFLEEFDATGFDECFNESAPVVCEDMAKCFDLSICLSRALPGFLSILTN